MDSAAGASDLPVAPADAPTPICRLREVRPSNSVILERCCERMALRWSSLLGRARCADAFRHMDSTGHSAFTIILSLRECPSPQDGGA